MYKNDLFPVLGYFLVQFIEDNVKFIVDETELRKGDSIVPGQKVLPMCGSEWEWWVSAIIFCL